MAKILMIVLVSVENLLKLKKKPVLNKTKKKSCKSK